MTRVDDERTFENAVPLTPEQDAANTAHFEGKGYSTNVDTIDDNGKKTPAEEKPKEGDTAAGDKDADDTVTHEVDGTPVEADILAEFSEESKKPDGERLGYQARRTRKIKALEAESIALKAEKEILERQLRERNSLEPPKPSAFTPPPIQQETKTAPPPAAQIEEDIKPKVFDKPRPKVPKLEDFSGSDEPMAAHANATAQFAEDLYTWDKQEREFNDSQRDEVSRKQRERDQEKTQKTATKEAVDRKFEAVRKAHPDFDVVTSGDRKLTPVLSYLLVDALPDGLELGYDLFKPEHSALFEELRTESNTKDMTSDQIHQKIGEIRDRLAVFRADTKRAASSKGADAAAPPPADTKPPADVKPPEVQTSSTPVPPKRDAPAPTHLRGGGATAGLRIEDIDPMDSDARRKRKKELGMM